MKKTQIQALSRTRPVFPMLPGTPKRASHDYVRRGTSSLSATLDLTTGKVIGSLHARHDHRHPDRLYAGDEQGD